MVIPLAQQPLIFVLFVALLVLLHDASVGHKTRMSCGGEKEPSGNAVGESHPIGCSW